LRLLSSDLRQPASELSIPPRQAGSSIMPGKVNPVIPEFVVSAAHRIYANDMLIASLSGQGLLELNAYLPVIGCTLIESLKLLIACAKTVKENLLEGLQVNVTAGFERLMKSPAVTTALVPYIGYHKAGELARLMKEKQVTIFEANAGLKAVDPQKLRDLLLPENLLKLGFSLDDVME
ncbi:MAG TPA: lyase family protein, partial [Bacteroidales bacterium]|nr:lyase family protein [Bacteroidales bacterium]